MKIASYELHDEDGAGYAAVVRVSALLRVTRDGETVAELPLTAAGAEIDLPRGDDLLYELEVWEARIEAEHVAPISKTT